MIYKVFETSPTKLEKILNDLAEVGWRLHSTSQVYGSSVLVTMQIEKGKA